MSKKGLCGGDATGNSKPSDACVQEIQHRLNFSLFQDSRKEILEYVHSDLWGSFPVKPYGGCQYFVPFINDYSRKIWVYFLKKKDEDEVFGRFKEWKAMVKK